MTPPPPFLKVWIRDCLLSLSKKTLDWGTRLEPQGVLQMSSDRDGRRNFGVKNFHFQYFLGWKILASIFVGSFIIILSRDFLGYSKQSEDWC